MYIKGTLNGNMFTPAAGVLTTTVPTTEDGYTYILLGLMSTTVNAVLAPEHPMFSLSPAAYLSLSSLSLSRSTVFINIGIIHPFL